MWYVWTIFQLKKLLEFSIHPQFCSFCLESSLPGGENHGPIPWKPPAVAEGSRCGSRLCSLCGLASTPGSGWLLENRHKKTCERENITNIIIWTCLGYQGYHYCIELENKLMFDYQHIINILFTCCLHNMNWCLISCSPKDSPMFGQPTLGPRPSSETPLMKRSVMPRWGDVFRTPEMLMISDDFRHVQRRSDVLFFGLVLVKRWTSIMNIELKHLIWIQSRAELATPWKDNAFFRESEIRGRLTETWAKPAQGCSTQGIRLRLRFSCSCRTCIFFFHALVVIIHVSVHVLELVFFNSKTIPTKDLKSWFSNL